MQAGIIYILGGFKLILYNRCESYLVRFSKSLVHSLGSKIVIFRVSVGNGVREPQCESVKR